MASFKRAFQRNKAPPVDFGGMQAKVLLLYVVVVTLELTL